MGIVPIDPTLPRRRGTRARWGPLGLAYLAGVLRREGHIEGFIFLDGMFTADRERVAAFADLWQARGLHTRARFSIQARADALDDETLGRLKAAGCYQPGVKECGRPGGKDSAGCQRRLPAESQSL